VSRVPILTWHSLDDSGSVISTSPARFRAQIRVLRERGFQGIALRDLADAWEGRSTLPPRPLVLTFDDGFRNVLEVAVPALQDAGFHATVFAVASYCGRANAWPEPAAIPRLPLLSAPLLRTLETLGFEVGAHGLGHVRLDQLPAAEAEREIVDSGRALADVLGHEVASFAYPYGRTTPAVRQIAAGRYRAACTDELRVAARNDDRHALPRVDMYYFRGERALSLFGTPLGAGYLEARRLARRLRTWAAP
jgi:peptidoglycan/xylan/chitin deacetylase (PgdA/CDA1 family)